MKIGLQIPNFTYPGGPEGLGRKLTEIEKTTLSTVHLAQGRMSAQEVIEECRALAGIGIEHAIFNMPIVHEITPLEIFGREIIPAVAEFLGDESMTAK